MKRRVLLGCFVLCCLAARAGADRGEIPFESDVKIFEPNQRAMIAWNGSEEILLLTTDLHASRKSKVLEVIPLPNEPKVKQGDTQAFVRATALINMKLDDKAELTRAEELGGPRPAELPAGEITFHEKIGAHDVNVARVLDPAGFVGWVNDYLKRAGAPNAVIPETLKASVGEYIRDGFTWFVFDVVELDTKPKTNEAIQYRFKTDALFYPLRISRTGEGQTLISLMILTPQLLKTFPGLPKGRVQPAHKPIAITSRELRDLSADMDDLLGHREDMRLRIWDIYGALSSFDKDLIAK
ncbi:MAG: DUF2330 domain-containing protein [Candidatus Sumerlaeia bacterium]